MEDYSTRISALHARLRELLSKDAVAIRVIRENRPPRFNVEGVYVISAPDREIVWVGRTRTNTVIGRLDHHLTRNQPSDLKVILKAHHEYPQNPDDYLVRCIEIADPRERAFFEDFSVSVLRPAFNRQ